LARAIPFSKRSLVGLALGIALGQGEAVQERPVDLDDRALMRRLAGVLACLVSHHALLPLRILAVLGGRGRRLEQEIAGGELAATLPRLFRTRGCRVKEIARDLEAQTPVALPLRLVEILVGGGLLGKGRIPPWYCVMSAGSSPVRVGLT